MSLFYRAIRTSNSKQTLSYWLFIFTLLVPIINGLANMTTNYFPPATLNPGFFRIVLLILFVTIAYAKAYIPNKTNNFIVGFAVYWVFLIPFAQNLPLNLMQTPKVILSLLLFPLGYLYINSIEKLKYLMGAILIAWSFFIFNFFIGLVFQVGLRGYGGEDSNMYFGSGGINISKTIALIYLIVPMFLKINDSKIAKWFAISLSILALPVLLISLKRAALLGLGAGFITYIVMTPFKGKILKSSIILGLILVMSAPLFWDRVIEVANIREKSLDFDDPEFADRESRIGEFDLVFQKFTEGTIKHKLFGTDLIYNNYLYGGARMLHTDYMMLLYGTGIIGFLWYFSIYWELIKKYFSFRVPTSFYREGKATLFALIVASMMISIAGSIGDLNLKSIFFLFAGGLIGTARTQYLLEKNKQISSVDVY